MSKDKRPFVDFRAIRAQVTMEQVLDHYQVLHTLKRTGNRLSGPCPIHHGNNPTQFRVDTEKNLWNCFSECKNGGNVLDFIGRMENCSIHEAAIKACEWFRIPLPEVRTGDSPVRAASKQPERSANITRAVPKAQPKTEPEDGTPNPPLKFKLEKLQREHPYLLKERGLSLETVIDLGLGYFAGDKGLMVGRIVIPIHNAQGELVAYAGRWPGEPPDKDTPKYKLPPGFKKSLELFNLDRAIREPRAKSLVIVEGFFDAIRLHQLGWRKVVALMGSDMSESQETLIRLHSHAGSHVIVMLDEDDAGKAGRDDIAMRLAKFCFVRVHQFEKPDTQPEHLLAGDLAEIMEGLP